VDLLHPDRNSVMKLNNSWKWYFIYLGDTFKISVGRWPAENKNYTAIIS